jgi:hypothetical protein
LGFDVGPEEHVTPSHASAHKSTFLRLRGRVVPVPVMRHGHAHGHGHLGWQETIGNTLPQELEFKKYLFIWFLGVFSKLFTYHQGEGPEDFN